MSLVALWFGVWLAAPPTVPGEIDHEPRDPLIYGGEDIDPGEWPAVVAVRTSKLCTGTLIAPDLILTAAHCFDPEPVADVRIYFGDDLATGNEVSSSEWGRHPDFCLPADCGEDLHDFAWVRLPAPVAIEPIIPITDPLEFDEVMRAGTQLWFVGYGEDESAVVGTKREVLASLTSFNESGREFRAGGGGKDTCLGDSGGPALVQLGSGEWRLAGVISRGGACGEGGIYGVPLPELCWLRDDSGTDLLPAGCEQCDCVMLNGEQPDEGCDCELVPVAPERAPSWWLVVLELGVIAGLGLWLRRGRAC
ncbi:S1 family peptidase [Enhygromyxa salina]|nr:trypsin-like serine protease [Enhygromyxa salina]